MKAQVDALAQPYLEAGILKGAAVGLVTADGPQVFGYGRIGGEKGRAPDGRTVFEIGSVTKVFTGDLLALAVRKGEVTLEDPVRNLLPESVKVPKHGEKEITLLHLATHTSGLPRLPSNMAPKDPRNPYADYTVAQLYDFLGGHKLGREPGKTAEYSNLGAGLLGHALALKAGKSYEELLVERICRPLAMADTRITLTPELKARLARGHDADGSPEANWDLPTLAGAGAIRSTTDDMVRFLQGHLGLVAPHLAPALQAAARKHHDAGGGAGVGLGWHVNADGLVWHNGQTGGYHAFAGFHPERRVGVVVLSNSAVMEVDQLGGDLVDLLLVKKVEPRKLRKAVPVDAKALDSYVGEYPLAPTFVLTITREGDGLAVQATGQPRFPLYAESETRFFLRVVDAQITFEKEGGKVTGLILHQAGRDQKAPRRK